MYIYIYIYISLSIYIYIYVYRYNIYMYDGSERLAPLRNAPAVERTVMFPLLGVHKGGFSKGGVSNLCVSLVPIVIR